MNKEELIKQVQELEKILADRRAEIEQLERQDRLKNYKDVKAGETFIYKEHEYTKLKNGKAIINNYDRDFMTCFFDNVNNDYDNSLIKHYINSEKFLNCLLLYRFDFSATGDYCELLSKEEYERNKDIIKKFGNRWWLRSSCCHNYYAYSIDKDGDVDEDVVNFSYHGVRPSFNFHDDIGVEVINE